jgi:hypothetical protein
VAFRTQHVTVYRVPKPQPIVTGPAPARVELLTQNRLALRLAGGGEYRVAVRYSPYWKPSTGCLAPGPDGMINLSAPAAGLVTLSFHLDAGGAIAAFTGSDGGTCASDSR